MSEYSLCLGCWKSKPINKFEISKRTGKPKSLCWTCKGRKVKHPQTVYYNEQLSKKEADRNKICNACFEEKNVSEFSPRGVNKNMAYRSECRDCEAEYRRTEKYKSDARRRSKEDPLRTIKRNEYRAKNKDRINAQRRARRAVFGPSPREVYWRSSRRAKEKCVRNELPPNFMEIARDHWGDFCQKCGSSEDIHFDHIVPLSWGLVSSNSWANLQLLCASCNLQKSYRVTIDFRDMSIPIYDSYEKSFEGVDILKLLGDEDFARL